MSKNVHINDIVYMGTKSTTRKKLDKESVEVIGIDTETDNTGKCFLICTSTSDVYNLTDLPACLFKRKYAGKVFVAYNLKFDQGSLLQFLPDDLLKELWDKEKVEYGKYKVKVIANKCLTISHGHHSVHFYDMYNFYGGSLEYNSQLYLGKSKLDMETKTFNTEFVCDNISKIIDYCIQDAVLVQELAELIIRKFEAFGVHPKKLYSTAYVSYQYFKTHTFYVTVKRYWDNHRKVLDYAMQSYNGGKFEVTEKGSGYYYEYDIVSAYPFEISNLIDISYCRVIESDKYRPTAIYGFIKCKMKIPPNIPSPIAVSRNNVNVYPCGVIEKVITKAEYEYFIQNNVDIEIIDGIWLHIDKKVYPYKKEILKLMEYKYQFKKEKKLLDYHTVKIFMNSIYGKMVQLTPFKDRWKATTCWNPIYGSIITANTRLKVTEMQLKYPSIIAVHTDSLISTTKLPISTSKMLGDFDFECEGKGLIIGSGIYQIGNKNKFRGFELKTNFFELFDVDKATIDIESRRPYTWREVVFRNMGTEFINRFVEEGKQVHVNFDKKRIWLDDYTKFSEVLQRNVSSVPIYNTKLL